LPASERKPKRYHHCYATANDRRLYLKDIKNLLRLAERTTGVGKVHLYIAVSTVNKPGAMDKFFEKTVQRLFENHPEIDLKSITYKANVGRDFSSYSVLRNLVLLDASDEDFTFFQNRSAVGPFKDNWYASFIDQFSKYNDVALCGSTINVRDHPGRSKDIIPHIQTYAFLTTAHHLRLLPSVFPGEDETKRLQIILNGEIGLSQFFIHQDYGITCMERNDLLVNKNSVLDNVKDKKDKVEGDHDFYHRFYLRRNKHMKMKSSRAWRLYLRSALNKNISESD